MKTVGYANEELFRAPGHGWYRTKEEAMKHVPEEQIEHFQSIKSGLPIEEPGVESKDELRALDK